MSEPQALSPEDVGIVERGRQARRLLADDVLLDAFTEAKANAMAQWISSKDPEEREKCHARVLAADEVQSVLEMYVGEVEVFEAQQPVDEETTDEPG